MFAILALFTLFAAGTVLALVAAAGVLLFKVVLLPLRLVLIPLKLLLLPLVLLAVLVKFVVLFALGAVFVALIIPILVVGALVAAPILFVAAVR